jgi:hypothetical protein
MEQGMVQSYNRLHAAGRQCRGVFPLARPEPDILAAKKFGGTHPVASNYTPRGRAQNRRIEIVLEGPRRPTAGLVWRLFRVSLSPKILVN